MLSKLQVQLCKEEVLKNNCAHSFLQTPFWAEFKSMHGWSHSFYTITAYIDDILYEMKCSVLIRTFSRFFSLCYIPLGLELPEGCHFTYNSDQYLSLLRSFCKELSLHCPRNTLCIRIDPPVSFSSLEETQAFMSTLSRFSPLVKSDVNIQPPDTVILNLFQTDEELLEQMKSKWRYNIRLAEKKGVSISKGSAGDIDVFYHLYEQTALRDGIAIHSKKYYESLFTLAEKKDSIQVSMYNASHEGTVIASIITLFTKAQGIYLYGASSNQKRNLMSTYLLQWKAIQDAKAYGCRFYDFYGIPPTDDEHHPMHGLYRFKTGFGGIIHHRIGSIDYPVSFLYSMYTSAEKIRNFWYKKIKKNGAFRRS